MRLDVQEFAAVAVGALAPLILQTWPVEGLRCHDRIVHNLVLLIDPKRRPAPNYDRDAAELLFVLLGWQRIDAVLPVDVDAVPERVGHAVRLREVHERPILTVSEDDLPLSTQRNADSDVLLAGPPLAEGGSVMVQGLPIGSINVPIKSHVRSALDDAKVVHDVREHASIRLRVFWRLRNQVTTVLPRSPSAILSSGSLRFA
mmetsp:Transcript_80341/g.260368  ORF Transcript_80341/g.260368 Transcript_80341/m.260368 type:complete len:202 (-) Transcript_80341:883-1488(-)